MINKIQNEELEINNIDNNKKYISKGIIFRG